MRLVLVPLDGSTLAENALPYALAATRRTGARLELVVVHQRAAPRYRGYGVPPIDPRLDADVRGALERYVHSVTQRLRRSSPRVKVRGLLLDGEPAEMLAAHVERTAPDLVVLTTHGRGGLSRLWMGSITETLLRRLTVPMLITRPRRKGPAPRTGSGFDRVLIPLDGAPASETAIESARRVVGTEKTKYTLLQVALPLHPVVRSFASRQEYERDIQEQRSLAERYLGKVEARLRRRGLRVSSGTCVDLQPARGILAFAREVNADLIALATHGRGPVGRFLLGSVADKVLRGSPVPVLLCHAPRRDGRP